VVHAQPVPLRSQRHEKIACGVATVNTRSSPAEDITAMEKKIWATIPKDSRAGLIVVLPYICEFGVAVGRKGLG
jgi:hypothetical protein